MHPAPAWPIWPGSTSYAPCSSPQGPLMCTNRGSAPLPTRRTHHGTPPPLLLGDPRLRPCIRGSAAPLPALAHHRHLLPWSRRFSGTCAGGRLFPLGGRAAAEELLDLGNQLRLLHGVASLYCRSVLPGDPRTARSVGWVRSALVVGHRSSGVQRPHFQPSFCVRTADHPLPGPAGRRLRSACEASAPLRGGAGGEELLDLRGELRHVRSFRGSAAQLTALGRIRRSFVRGRRRGADVRSWPTHPAKRTYLTFPQFHSGSWVAPPQTRPTRFDQSLTPYAPLSVIFGDFALFGGRKALWKSRRAHARTVAGLRCASMAPARFRTRRRGSRWARRRAAARRGRRARPTTAVVRTPDDRPTDATGPRGEPPRGPDVAVPCSPALPANPCRRCATAVTSPRRR
jgi:hypothetical protein